MALLLIVAGPAGSGKTTLCTRLLEAYSPAVERVITVTTRPRRSGERNGIDYFFLSPEEFESKVRSDTFYEHTLVHGNYRYGTLKCEVQTKLAQQVDLLLNIDVQGVGSWRQAAASDPEVRRRLVSVFIQPKSISQIRRRLHSRGTDDQAEIGRRLETAREEFAERSHFDHVIVSGSRKADFQQLCRIYEKERQRRRD